MQVEFPLGMLPLIRKYVTQKRLKLTLIHAGQREQNDASKGRLSWTRWPFAIWVKEKVPPMNKSAVKHSLHQ